MKIKLLIITLLIVHCSLLQAQLAPVACFTGTASASPPLCGVVFADSSLHSPTSWYWNFGDGTMPSTVKNPTHVYSGSGTYTVSLTVSNAYGSNILTKTNVINAISICYYDTVTYSACDGITGLLEAMDMKYVIKISPNPATNILYIEAPQKSQIEISNIEGQIIKSIAAGDNTTTIDVSNFARGMYFVKVKTGKGITVKKFVKN
jgi:PKD repeat protein